MKRTGSGRTMPINQSRGGRSRPGLLRRKSSQTRPSARSSETAGSKGGVQEDEDSGGPNQTGPATAAVGACVTGEKSAQARPAFEIASSWQSDDESVDEKMPKSSLGPSGSLVEPDFRNKFAMQRQLSSGTSLPTMASIRTSRSSVRFADNAVIMDSGKGKAREESDNEDDSENRGRSNSHALADSDDPEEQAELPRVHSQLSMMIQDRRKQSGNQDVGPSSQPEGGKFLEARRKRDELLKMGREAAAPIIPTSRSRRTSRDKEEDRYRSPSPNATF
jgi:hypothetical protein